MKKLLLSLLFLTAIANAQIVTIPDANFKAKLIALGVDTNLDGNIQQSEALTRTSLDLTNSNISNLTGIDAFQNMTILNCSNNHLTALTISLPNLLVFLCMNNQLTSLNFSTCTSLNNFDATNNHLTSLDFSNNHNIAGITAEQNSLTSINLSGCSQLYWLHLSTNNLTSIDLTGLSTLNELIAPYNQITSVNVSALTALTKIVLPNNNLASLDTSGLQHLTNVEISDNPSMTSLNVSNCPLIYMILADDCGISSLNTLNCPALYQVSLHNNGLSSVSFNNLPNLYILDLAFSNITNLTVTNCPHLHLLSIQENNIQTLDLSDCTALDNLSVSDNPDLVSLFIKNGKNEYVSMQDTPNLRYICADEDQVATLQSQASPDAVVSTYCSFLPGGNYNSISGVVRYDQDNNGCDALDPKFPNSIRLAVTNGTISSSVFPNTDGDYTLFTATGANTITPSLENPSYFNVSPATATFTFPTLNNTVETQNFCLTANGIHNDLEIVIIPIIHARPGFDARYKIVYKNKGNQILSGTVNFTFDDAVLDFMEASTTPDVVNTGELVWNFTNLLPFADGDVEVTLNANSPIETPPVVIGDVLNFAATINPVLDDATPSDNIFSLSEIVVGSFDPNDKICLEGTTVSPNSIGDYLHYNINFENTGNFEAENIVVKDMIDTSKFDINSLQILNTSHPAVTRITGDKAEFIFENINLAAGQHGNVTFKIKTKNTLVTGNAVANTADIYFDYNAPVTTNTTSTTFQTLGINENEDNSVNIYPNPTKGVVNVNSHNTIRAIQLFDVNGRLLMTKISDGLQAAISVSDYANGIYLLKVSTEKGVKTEKIVKE